MCTQWAASTDSVLLHSNCNLNKQKQPPPSALENGLYFTEKQKGWIKTKQQEGTRTAKQRDWAECKRNNQTYDITVQCRGEDLRLGIFRSYMKTLYTARLSTVGLWAHSTSDVHLWKGVFGVLLLQKIIEKTNTVRTKRWRPSSDNSDQNCEPAVDRDRLG